MRGGFARLSMQTPLLRLANLPGAEGILQWEYSAHFTLPAQQAAPVTDKTMKSIYVVSAQMLLSSRC